MLRVAVMLVSLSQGYVPTEEYMLLNREQPHPTASASRQGSDSSIAQAKIPDAKQPSMNTEIGQTIKTMILENAKKQHADTSQQR